MKPEVRYLARLARQAAGQPMLQPRRQLFSNDIGMAADGQDTRRERRADLRGGGHPAAEPVPAAGSLAAPATAAWPGPADDTPAVPGGPDVPGPSRAAPPPPGVAGTGLPGAATAGPADLANCRPGPPGAPPNPANGRAGTPAAGTPEPPPSIIPRPPSGAGQARPPGSWASLQWGEPVELPVATERAPAPDPADGWAVPISGAAPAMVPAGPGLAGPGLGPGPAAGPRADQRTGDAATPAAIGTAAGPAARSTAGGPGAPGIAAAPAPGAAGVAGVPRALGVPAGSAADPDPPEAPGAVRDLMPPRATDPPPGAIPGAEPGETYREPREPRGTGVSIGTIEVTIVPPAIPAPAAPEMPPPAPVATDWSQLPSPLAASAGADRLRDGFRRWYGTAQG